MRRVVAVAMGGLALALLWFLPTASQAASVSTKQVSPGMTARTIWDTAKVACYRLPDGVDHTGYIHVELKFKPAWADLDLYLLDSQGHQVGGIAGEQGRLAFLFGGETIDYRVNQVSDTSIVTGSDGPDMVGDTYYLLVVAFNETAKGRLWGYYPQIDLSASADVTASGNYFMKWFTFPKDPGATFTLRGPGYGQPYVIRPTSVGSASCRLEWPADAALRTVTYDPVGAPKPASMGQYLYAGSSWEGVFEDEGGWSPPPQDGWWGLLDVFAVASGTTVSPQQELHYVPNLYAAASDPSQGDAAPPKTGVVTRGFKATVTYPENLRISSVVKSGSDRVVNGTFALNGGYVGGATVVLQRQAGSRWILLRTLKTDAAGRWSSRLHSTGSMVVRAKAAGDPATGLAVEYSTPRTISF